MRKSYNEFLLHKLFTYVTIHIRHDSHTSRFTYVTIHIRHDSHVHNIPIAISIQGVYIVLNTCIV